jgi:hypothetical protein
MPIIIDPAVSCLPERINQELSHEIASGRRGGPLSDAVLPLNAALLSRAAKIDTLSRQLSERDATVSSQRAEIERLRAILQQLVDDLGEDHGADDFEAECPSCQLVKSARAALTKPEQE